MSTIDPSWDYLKTDRQEDQKWNPSESEELDVNAEKSPLPPVVSSFFDKIKDAHYLNGGKSTDWPVTEKLVKKWIKEARKHFFEAIPDKITRLKTSEGLVTKYKNGEIKLSIESTFYTKEFPNIQSSRLVSDSEARDNSKNLAARVIQLTTLGKAQELNKGISGIATIEYDIIEAGGWLVGFNKKEVLVYFPLASEIMIKKLKAKK